MNMSAPPALVTGPVPKSTEPKKTPVVMTFPPVSTATPAGTAESETSGPPSCRAQTYAPPSGHAGVFVLAVPLREDSLPALSTAETWYAYTVDPATPVSLALVVAVWVMSALFR